MSAARTGRFTPGKSDPGTNWLEGQVSPTAVLGFRRRENNFLPLPGFEPKIPHLVVLCFCSVHVICQSSKLAAYSDDGTPQLLTVGNGNAMILKSRGRPNVSAHSWFAECQPLCSYNLSVYSGK